MHRTEHSDASREATTAEDPAGHLYRQFEWIFDRDTYRALGSKYQDGRGYISSAGIRAGVVDRVRQLPG